MTKEEAIKFFKKHAEWSKESWSMTPEGRLYQEKFESCINALINPIGNMNSVDEKSCSCPGGLLEHFFDCKFFPKFYRLSDPDFFDTPVAKKSIDNSCLTTDPADPRLGRGTDDKPVSQNEVYLVLSEEERAKGFVRPLRRSYKHVGERPKYTTRPLTEEEKERYKDFNYVCYETSPKDLDFYILGRYWTEKQLNSGCRQTTTMGLELCETYARNPRFYRSTYCTCCQKHLPVEEFIWIEDGERVGS